MALGSHSKEDLGWDAFFEAAFDLLGPEIGLPGRVVAQHTHIYRVWTEAEEILAAVSGRFRHTALGRNDYPAVGDWVAVSPAGAGGRGVIGAVLPRKSRFARKVAGDLLEEQVVAANVDTVFLVAGLDGDFNPRRIERALVLARESGAAPVLVLNKVDLCPNLRACRAEIEPITSGVPVHVLSAKSGEGLSDLTVRLEPRKTVALLGSSGVGKSTLINALLGETRMRTNEVRMRTNEVRMRDSRGRHTTSHRELLVLASGALVIDTPGLRELQLWADGDSVRETFDDVEELARACAFRDCRHSSEPNCAVLSAVRDGRLSEDRLSSYRKLESETLALERRREALGRQAQGRRSRSIHKAVRNLKPKRG